MLCTSASMRALYRLSKPEDTNYALTLAILPGDDLHFRLIYDPARVSHESVQTYATDLKTILDAIAGQHASNVG